MTTLAEQLRHGADQAWESLSTGWRELSASASGALTRFWPTAADPPAAGAPNASKVSPRRLAGWAFMAADVFDDADNLIVRIEAPGLRREDFNVELNGDVLSVWGEKRLYPEVVAGNWRVVQCAYGSFRRDVALPVSVKPGQTEASYRDGVLYITLPKADGARARRIAVKES